MAEMILIDTDGGVDDAMALMLAGASPEIDLCRITTVAGNVPVPQATRNVGLVASFSARLQKVPVNPGHERPLLRPLRDATEVHGPDGLGDLGRLRDADGSPRYPVPAPAEGGPFAVPMILEEIASSPALVTLLAIGPLTNVAATCLADPAAFARLGRLVIMGGAVFGRGNITAHAEYNFFVDPEAVAIVLRSPVEKLIVPLEVCEQVVLERRQVVEWSEIHRSPSTRFLRDITEHYMNFYRAARGVDGCHPHDAIALAAVLKPSLFRWERSELMVELGEERRGQLRVATDGAYPVSVATDVDSPALLALLRERLWELSSSEARRLGSVSPH